MRLARVALALFPMIGGGASAQENLRCIQSLELPRFATASMSPKGGTVTVSVEVTSKGVAGKASFAGEVAETTKHEVEHHVRNRATYDARCAGKSVALKFTFKVEGEPNPTPFSRVIFIPPSEFVIITQPAAPVVDRIYSK